MATEEQSIPREDGDVHDGDTGDYYFTLEKDAGLPATLDILHEGYWYTYKIEGRRPDKPDEIEIPKEDHAEVDTALGRDISKIDIKDL